MEKQTDKKDQRSRVEQVKSVLPEVWALVQPRRKLLAGGLGLIVISRAAGLVLPASTKFLIDDVIGQKQFDLLLPLVLAVGAATAIEAATSYSLTQLLSKSGQRLIAELRQKVHSHLARLPVAYYDSHKTGSLVSRVMSDVEGVRNLVGTGLVELVGGLLTAAAAFAALLYFSPKLTAVALLPLVVFGLVLKYAFTTLRPLFNERWKIRSEVSGRLTESLAGVRVVKGYHAEQREENVFGAGVQRMLDNVLSTITGTSLMSLAATVLMGGVGAMIMYVGARDVLAGRMLPGELIAFTAFLAFVVAPVFRVVSIATQLMEAFSGLERTREVFAELREQDDPQRTAGLGALRGEVCFERVNFAYEPGKPVLHEISFASRPGSVTALVGPSGSGKSTIIGLVAAFYKPADGNVMVDGVDLSTVKLSSYRTQLSVVLQETFLFDGSIRENVAFGRPDASEQEILEVCRIARVDEFAEKLEKSYDTIVGERGVKLSGGQRQRVAIARAILANPRILILDEATSSLDSESEAMIQQGLSFLMRGRTTFVIAHRLSTIRRADQILVVEDGRIIERGNHESLYASHGRYRDLYDKQHDLAANLFLAPGEGDEAEREVADKQETAPVGDPMSLLRGS
ncbi:MAG: ABC transporter ATP-binding protein [Bryobacterales bacterium]